jgi:hypothetical protein
VTAPTALTADEEGLHEPGPEHWWNESWYFDFARADGSFGGYVRVGLVPNQGVTWYLLHLVGQDRPTVRIDDKRLVPSGLGIGTETYAFSHTGTDGTWRIAGSGTAESLAPTDILEGAGGKPVEVEVDLTWTADGLPFRYDVTTRYELPCLVSGSVTVDGEVLVLDAVEGQRDHSWGVRDWSTAGWCWAAARLADGTRLHLTDVVFPDFRFTTGYLQDGTIEVVTDVERTDGFEAGGLPTVSRQVLAPSGLEVTITSLAHGPTLMSDEDGATWPFQRSLARFETAEGTGVGWIEWNRIELRI